MLQHPLGALAPGPSSAGHNDDDNSNIGSSSHPLGIVPHQIRGYLARFQNLLVKGASYDRCSACSPNVLAAYDEGGWEFVKRVLNEKGYVEELSGLAAVSSQTPSPFSFSRSQIFFGTKNHSMRFSFSVSPLKYLGNLGVNFPQKNTETGVPDRRCSARPKRHWRRWNGVMMKVPVRKEMGN